MGGVYRALLHLWDKELLRKLGDSCSGFVVVSNV